MSQEQETYTGQTFTGPVYINGNLQTNPQIAIARPPYLLERYDFDKIIRGESFWLTMAQTFLGAGLGLFVNMISKLIGSKVNNRINFDDWEVYAFIIAILLMSLSYVVNHFVPNEKRRIVARIKKHYENG